jgi:hypothetical protein
LIGTSTIVVSMTDRSRRIPLAPMNEMSAVSWLSMSSASTPTSER